VPTHRLYERIAVQLFRESSRPVSSIAPNIKIPKTRMICHFALIIALLCLEPSRVDSMYFGNVLRDTVGHNPLFEAQNIEHVGLMSEQASQKIHESYLKSDKRLILLGDDVSHIFMHDS